MTDVIQAIETIWAGCRFRSRLEARWAVFFNAIGYTIGEDCLYEYDDVIGFDGKSQIRYLPDFYFPKEGIYAEVKGTTEALQHDSEKIGMCIEVFSKFQTCALPFRYIRIIFFIRFFLDKFSC